jgi:hypothetical protein
MIDKYGHEDEWHEEIAREHWIRKERRRLSNRDSFYPNSYFENDHAEELQRLEEVQEKP